MRMPSRPVAPECPDSVPQRADVHGQWRPCRYLHNLPDDGVFAQERFDGRLCNRLVENWDLFAFHNGINPCFLAGRQSRLLESDSSASAR